MNEHHPAELSAANGELPLSLRLRAPSTAVLGKMDLLRGTFLPGLCLPQYHPLSELP